MMARSEELILLAEELDDFDRELAENALNSLEDAAKEKYAYFWRTALELKLPVTDVDLLCNLAAMNTADRMREAVAKLIELAGGRPERKPEAKTIAPQPSREISANTHGKTMTPEDRDFLINIVSCPAIPITLVTAALEALEAEVKRIAAKAK